MIYREFINRLNHDDSTDIIEDVCTLMDTRKMLDMDEFSEYALISRPQLEDLFYKLVGHRLIPNGFEGPRYRFEGESH